MTWLLVMVRLDRAAPRHRRRVFALLEGAGAVSVSPGVWAVPETEGHRRAVDHSAALAVDAGGDVLVLPTSSENSSINDFLQRELTGRLTRAAEALAIRCDEYEALVSGGSRPGAVPDGTDEDFVELQREATSLSGMDVIGIEAVASVVARVRRTRRPRESSEFLEVC